MGIVVRKAFYLLLMLPLLISNCDNSSGNNHNPDESIVYFLVTEIPGTEFHEDSFVVGIKDPDDIEYARSLIYANGEDQGQGTIIVCEIAAGSDGINRDLFSDYDHLWSWHVVEFLDFAQTTAEILDGCPTYVESDVTGWINNTNSQIGFWGYTITRELDEAELDL